MRSFADIERDLGLVLFADSALGDLYCVPVAPGAPRIVVRRFNRELPAALAPAYAEVLRAAQAWLARDSALAKLVRVAQPIEVGSDFVVRPHLLGDSLASFADDEDPPESPPELPLMRERFRALASETASQRDALLVKILVRSVLEPTAKTIYSFSEERFIIADLKPSRRELELWVGIREAPP